MNNKALLVLMLFALPITCFAELSQEKPKYFLDSYSVEDSKKWPEIPDPMLWDNIDAPRYIKWKGLVWECIERDTTVRQCIKVMVKPAQVDPEKHYTIHDIFDFKRQGRIYEMKAIPFPGRWDVPGTSKVKKWWGRLWYCVKRDEKSQCDAVKVYEN